MHKRHAFSAGALALLIASCASGDPTPPGERVEIRVAPFEIEPVTNATYILTVRNAADEVVWTRQVDADGYGNGKGSLSYVGSCDASSNPNTVAVEVNALFMGAAGTDPIDSTTYDLPGEVTRQVDCVADQDVPVEFDITILIDPPSTNSFVSIGVGFADIFCSAKLDCLDAHGDPLELLHDATGARAQTAVVAMSCTAGQGEDTVLYREDLVVHCDDGAGTVLETTVDPSAGPGNLAVGAGISGDGGVLYGAAVTLGDEQLGYNKAYWNVLLGLEPGARGCTLTTRGTANTGAFPGDTVPEGTVWPYIDWNVQLTDTAGNLVCTTHPVGGDAPDHDGVIATYTDGTAVAWTHIYFSAAASSATLIGALTDADPGRWGDGTYAASCDAYRYPTDGHGYAGSTGDGVYAIDPDGDGTPFTAYCDMTADGGGWTLLATLHSTDSGSTANWPSWTAAWWTLEHGTPTDPTVSFSNHDMRLFRALIDPTRVVRASSPSAAISRYHFNMTPTDWDLWNTTRTVNVGQDVRLVGPFGSPTATQVSTSPDLSGAVTATLNGHWDSGYFYLGTATGGGDTDGDLGARYHVATNIAGTFGYVGDVRQSALWHLWLK